jgi:hypothetical protein
LPDDTEIKRLRKEYERSLKSIESQRDSAEKKSSEYLISSMEWKKKSEDISKSYIEDAKKWRKKEKDYQDRIGRLSIDSFGRDSLVQLISARYGERPIILN